jgi:GTP diphosphokinase / guanosine-3',5'-bis(diphosphate) 3'-diphosphatase
MNEEIHSLDTETLKYFKALRRDCKDVCNLDEMKKIKEAFVFMSEFCSSRQERWGKAALIHAIEVARIVTIQTGLAGTSIIAAMFIECIDDEDFNLELVKEKFGNKVAELLEGLQKISSIKTDKSSSQAENFRNLILSMASDVRVILIKLSERLYVLRNIENLPEDERIQIATETSHIYSPLAHRLGLYNMMSELEDISMKYVEPDAYHMIEEKLEASQAKRNKFIREFIKPVKEELETQGFKVSIKGRPKAISSIWRKMRRQKVDFEEVYDKFAIRVIIDTALTKEKADCWRAYSIITDFYQPDPERLRDWISVPKSNGYESLHSTINVEGEEWVEVQIRSKRMDEIAEKGLAAHWKYKGIKGEKGMDEWLSKVREFLDNQDEDASKLLDNLTVNLYNKEIFAFTPTGDLKRFPEGATVLDFAFDIHSAVGSTCIGAKVNGKNVPIRHKLKNGDKVEIIRSKNQKPNIDWLKFVSTTKAKTKIRLALKEAKLKEAENGKEILRRRFKNWKIEFLDLHIRKLLNHYKYNDAIDLYYDIATEKLNLLEIKDILTEDEKYEHKPVAIQDELIEKIIKPVTEKTDDFLIIDDKLANIDYHLAKCCNPIFGDDIFGFVTRMAGITIHRANCPNAPQLLSKYGYRMVKAKWTQSDAERFFITSIRITGNDDIGIFSNISDVISKDLKVNMRSVKMDSSDGMFDGTIHLFVKDRNHLDVLIRKLIKVKGVLSVKRMD